MTPGVTTRPLRAEDDRPNNNLTVPVGNGPCQSDSIGWVSIWGISTTRMAAQMSSPAEPGVALLGCSGVLSSESVGPHIFVGPGVRGPVFRFLIFVYVLSVDH